MKREERKRKKIKVRKTEGEELLREVIVKIGLKRVDTQEGITVETLLDSGATGLVMSSEFTRKTGMAEAEGRGEEKRSRKEKRRKDRKTKETEESKDNRCKESS